MSAPEIAGYALVALANLLAVALVLRSRGERTARAAGRPAAPPEPLYDLVAEAERTERTERGTRERGERRLAADLERWRQRRTADSFLPQAAGPGRSARAEETGA